MPEDCWGGYRSCLARSFARSSPPPPPAQQPPQAASHLAFSDKIKVSGPISVFQYMQTCLGAYYASKLNEGKTTILGEKGDFITSPELSQMFGELIGVWCYYELANTGHKGNWQLIEVGPGTGVLSRQVLGVLHHFREKGVSLHLVEVSDMLMAEQEKTLCGDNKGTDGTDATPYVRRNKTANGTDVYWYRQLKQVPSDFSVILAHEFLDALPVYQFKRVGPTEGDWREVFVDVDPDHSGKLRFALSPNETLHSKGLLPPAVRADPSIEEWEVNVDAGDFVSQMADRLTESGGVGLVIDYGHAGDRKRFSLRSYHNHQLADPLDNPGQQDLTADVDFGHLKSLVEEDMCVYGPISQSDFLNNLGIHLRLMKLLRNCTDEQQREQLKNAFRIMMSADEMGARFKAMAFFPKSLKEILDLRGGPSGFAGDAKGRTQSKSTST
uniref:Protein arginine methyltransferase NDUFAF7 n=1 Tax=Plectus sambesii TaxID=2011161 RepID=A0A914WWB7_9BILA